MKNNDNVVITRGKSTYAHLKSHCLMSCGDHSKKHGVDAPIPCSQCLPACLLMTGLLHKAKFNDCQLEKHAAVGLLAGRSGAGQVGGAQRSGGGGLSGDGYLGLLWVQRLLL